MKKIFVLIAHILTGTVLVIFFSGCTILGGIAGYTATSGPSMASDEEAFGPGTRVKVYQGRRRTVNGIFMGIEDRIDGEFISRYNAFSSDPEVRNALPRLDDSVSLSFIDGGADQIGRFQGFGGYNRTYIRISSGGGEVEIMPLERISTINHSAVMVTPAQSILEMGQELPKCTYLLLDRNRGRLLIPIEQVTKIRRRVNRVLGGMIIGAAVDAGIVYAVMSTLSFGGGWGS